jgi:hypothetical protein
MKSAPPLLPEHQYWGTIIQVDAARAAFPPRKRERDLQRDRWTLYVHVRLEDGNDQEARRALAQWRAGHAGQSPIVFCPVSFYTLPGKTIPEAPRLKDRLFKIFSMLAGHRLQRGERFDFEAFVNLYALVDVRTSWRDSDGDAVPATARYSFGKKILALKPCSSLLWAERGVGGWGSRVVGQGSQVLATGNGVGSLDHSQPTNRPGEDGDPSVSPGSTPSPAAIRAAIERTFGKGVDVAERGRCPRCGAQTYGRPGEMGRCVFCP